MPGLFLADAIISASGQFCFFVWYSPSDGDCAIISFSGMLILLIVGDY